MSNNKPTFGRWLAEYEGDNLKIKDLRDDFNCDIRLSNYTLRNYRSAEAVRSRMFYKGACNAAMAALHEAAEEYGTPFTEEEDD